MRHLFGANTSGGTSTNLEGSLPSDALAAHAEAVGEAPVLGEVPAQGEPPVVGETAQTALTLARPWQRLLGALVDSGLILFPVLGAISLGIFGGSVAHASLLEPEDVGLLLVNGDLSALIVVGLAITVIMSSLTTGLLGRSPGKLLFGLEVVTVRDGARPSLLRAISRAILTPVGMILGGSGLFWLLVDRKARTLHDVLSGTIVVVRSSRRVMA
ncbi:MAG: RDD family protein [Deltaproteobacteria bacterium]|nr:RDD family protein [Deltaproteobacteria bacterium]